MHKSIFGLAASVREFLVLSACFEKASRAGATPFLVSELLEALRKQDNPCVVELSHMPRRCPGVQDAKLVNVCETDQSWIDQLG